MSKNILICLDILDVGGVETFVYNQALAMKNKGYNVYILSKKGILVKDLESKGINCIEFEFENEVYYDIEKINKIVEIIKEYDIKEIHINQFTAMNAVFPACIITNTPYIVYLHLAAGLINNEEHNVYNWLEKQYKTYKEDLNLLFKYAYKIIGITKEIKDYTVKRYNIDESKCIVYPNSINFENYACKREIEKIKNILIVSRFSNEKINSIINGIDFYTKYKEKCKEKTTLTLVGDGEGLKQIKEYTQKNNIKDVTFLGKLANTKNILEKSDLLIGVDRCILEALAMKRLALVSGYDTIKEIIKESNIEKEISENFCGKSLNENKIEDLVNELINLSKEDIKKIAEYNYEKIREKLNIENNIFIANLDFYKYEINFEEFYISMLKMNNILGRGEKEALEKIENNWKEHVAYKEWIEGKLEECKKELEKNRRKRWI